MRFRRSERRRQRNLPGGCPHFGSHDITASYAGDANNASSTSPILTQVVKQSADVVLTATPNPTVVTSSVTLTATVTATVGVPTGSLTFYDGSVALGAANVNSAGSATLSTTQLQAGTHSLTAKYSGDGMNAANTSNVVSEVISQATTLTTLATSNATVAVGSSLTLTANVTSTNGPAPTGMVSFTEGTTTLGSATLNASGVASLPFSSLPPGTHEIVATYAGDASDAPSTSTALLQTVQQISTVTLLAASANPGSAGATLQFTAAVTASDTTGAGPITGMVTFTEGSVTLGTGTLNGSGVASFSTTSLAVGTHAIVATYAGSQNYAGSASSALSEQIGQTPTVTSLSAPSAASLSGKPVLLTATVSSQTGVPAGTVTFLDGATVLGQGSPGCEWHGDADHQQPSCRESSTDGQLHGQRELHDQHLHGDSAGDLSGRDDARIEWADGSCRCRHDDHVRRHAWNEWRRTDWNRHTSGRQCRRSDYECDGQGHVLLYVVVARGGLAYADGRV